jgi:hypothetical protein
MHQGGRRGFGPGPDEAAESWGGGGARGDRGQRPNPGPMGQRAMCRLCYPSPWFPFGFCLSCIRVGGGGPWGAFLCCCPCSWPCSGANIIRTGPHDDDKPRIVRSRAQLSGRPHSRGSSPASPSVPAQCMPVPNDPIKIKLLNFFQKMTHFQKELLPFSCQVDNALLAPRVL